MKPDGGYPARPGGHTVLVTDDAPNVVRFAGDIDFRNAPDLAAQGAWALAQAPDRPLIVDLGQVEFIDSVGLGALIELKRRAGELGTSMMLADVTEPARKVIAVTGLLDVFGLGGPGSE